MLSSNGIHSYVGDLLYRRSKRTWGPTALPRFIDKRTGKGRRRTPGCQSSETEPSGLRRRDGGRDMRLACTSVSGDSERNKSQREISTERQWLIQQIQTERAERQVAARLTTQLLVFIVHPSS